MEPKRNARLYHHLKKLLEQAVLDYGMIEQGLEKDNRQIMSNIFQAMGRVKLDYLPGAAGLRKPLSGEKM